MKKAIIVLLALLALSAVSTYSITPTQVDYVLGGGAAILGPTAPSFQQNDSCAGYALEAINEEIIFPFEIPDCWDGASNLAFKVYGCFKSGDAPQLNETIKLDLEWRSIDWETEDVDNGTLATGTVTYTEASDPGDDKDTVELEIAIAYTGGNQPLAEGDVVMFHLDRDTGADTYSGYLIVPLAEVGVYENKLFCDHK